MAAVLLAGALLVDHFGLIGLEPRPVTALRVAGALLLLLGLAVFLRS